jgi:hypothetical protein
MLGLDELRAKGGMTWIEEEHGWIVAPEDIVEPDPYAEDAARGNA